MSLITDSWGLREAWGVSERLLMGEQEAKYSYCIFKSFPCKNPALLQLSLWEGLVCAQTCSVDLHAAGDMRDSVRCLTF